MKKVSYLRPVLFALLLLSAVISSDAQDSLWKDYTDISKINLVKNISKTVSSTYNSKKNNPETGFSDLRFLPGLKHTGTIPNEFVSKMILVQFNIRNSADTVVSVYFFPGFYYKSIRLFRVTKNGIEKIPVFLPSINDSAVVRRITRTTHDSATVIAEWVYVKAYNNM